MSLTDSWYFTRGADAWISNRQKRSRSSLRHVSRCTSPAVQTRVSPSAEVSISTKGSVLCRASSPALRRGKSGGWTGSTATRTIGAAWCASGRSAGMRGSLASVAERWMARESPETATRLPAGASARGAMSIPIVRKTPDTSTSAESPGKAPAASPPLPDPPQPSDCRTFSRCPGLSVPEKTRPKASITSPAAPPLSSAASRSSGGKDAAGTATIFATYRSTSGSRGSKRSPSSCTQGQRAPGSAPGTVRKAMRSRVASAGAGTWSSTMSSAA